MAQRTTSNSSPSASLSFSKATIIPSGADDQSEMRPAMLDLLVLTFNCAKNLIEAPVLGEHLETALRGEEELPEVVVFSLQEIAPLAYSFVGSYFLAPYLDRFEEALNLAAVNVSLSTPSANDAGGSPGSSSTQIVTGAEQETGSWQWPLSLARRTSGKERTLGNNKAGRPYTLVRSANVGMTAILLFARDPAAVRNVEVAECGFGIADMGNKGAVGIRIAYSKGDSGDQEPTEFTFVAAHLAAMEWNLKRRNKNWRTISSGLTFRNPKEAITASDRLKGLGQGMRGRRVDSARSGVAPSAVDPEGGAMNDADSDSDGEEEWLLNEDQAAAHARHHDALREISVFKPTSYLFVAGDLNYRISSTTPETGEPFPGLQEDDDSSPSTDADDTSDVEGAGRPLLHWRNFLERDQLTTERRAGRTFRGLDEADVTFPPTYKFNVLDSPEGAVNAKKVMAADAGAREKGLVVPWQYAQHRWPSWCDRVLYLDVPAWARKQAGPHDGDAGFKIQVTSYDSLPVMRSSDHQPVFLRAQVPLLGRDAMAVPQALAEAEAEALGARDGEISGLNDPRLRLPVPVDVDAWERRAAAKRKELVLGWSALLWSTKEGAVVIGTLVFVGVGSWWAYQGFF